MASFHIELGPTGTLILFAVIAGVFGTVFYFVNKKKKEREKQLQQFRATASIQTPPLVYASPQK